MSGFMLDIQAWPWECFEPGWNKEGMDTACVCNGLRVACELVAGLREGKSANRELVHNELQTKISMSGCTIRVNTVFASFVLQHPRRYTYAHAETVPNCDEGSVPDTNVWAMKPLPTEREASAQAGTPAQWSTGTVMLLI